MESSNSLFAIESSEPGELLQGFGPPPNTARMCTGEWVCINASEGPK